MCLDKLQYKRDIKIDAKMGQDYIVCLRNKLKYISCFGQTRYWFIWM